MVETGDINEATVLNSVFQQEKTNIIRFKEQIDHSQSLTSSMLGILSSFDNRLAKLEETVLPLYQETENLQCRQKNLESTINGLDNIIGFYSVSTDVESIIKTGPSGPGGLDQFLNALDRLKQAQYYFEKNNPQSLELENICMIYNNGVDCLNREFKEMLLRHSKPFQPITLLDLISNDDDTTVTTDDSSSVGSLSHFPDNVVSDMVRISEWLISESRDEFMNVYARIRATILIKSLTLLKEHQRAGSANSIQIATSSPTIRSKFQNRQESSSSRRTSKRIQNLFEKKANRMLQRASQTLEHSTGFSLGSRRSMIHFGDGREDVIDEQEMENYLIIVMAVQKLMQIELSLLSSIIPIQHRYQVFQIIISEGLDTIVQEGASISSRVKRCINRHDYLNVLVIFPILKHLISMKPDFERIVGNCEQTVRNQFPSIINTLETTGLKILDDFVENIRSDVNTSLPKDGTVYQLTSDVMFFVEQLLDFTEIIGTVLLQDPFYVTALTSVSLEPKRSSVEKNKSFLAIYIRKVLSQLNLTLLNKSDFYSDIAVKGIFRLNNCNYILKVLQRSNLLQLLTICEPECENTYYSMIANHKKTYQQCWNKLLNYISVNEDIQPAAGKLKDKDRNILKEKFAGFNKEIDEISKIQRGYSIPDFELREGLKRDNKEIVLPKYNTFYTRFSSMPFAKNYDKYVKYTPEQISTFIDRFFDMAA